MTDVEKLQAQKTALLDRLLAMGTKPDYSIDGQAVQWATNRGKLLEEIALIDGLLAAAAGPWEIMS